MKSDGVRVIERFEDIPRFVQIFKNKLILIKAYKNKYIKPNQEILEAVLNPSSNNN